MTYVICDGCGDKVHQYQYRVTKEYTKLELCHACYNLFEDLRVKYVKEHQKEFYRQVRASKAKQDERKPGVTLTEAASPSSDSPSPLSIVAKGSQKPS